MDKLRAKAKARRREERVRAEREYKKDLARWFNDKFKEQGLKHRFKPNEISRAYRNLQREIAEEAVVTNSIITLYVMRRLHKFGALRLHRLAGEITVLVSDIGLDRRTLPQLEEALRNDAHLDYCDYWNKEAIPDVHGASAQRRNLLIASAQHTLPIQLTAIFYTLFPVGSISRKSVRMERITQNICGTVRRAIESGTIDAYRRELEGCGLKISMKGQFGSNKLSEEESDRLQRRIIA
ncbi:MAG: hypothetical protein J1G06_08575 [Oscillospiraceae bacterium]|nr:hypothetical protein [Oscillospiraceae bacterium]